MSQINTGSCPFLPQLSSDPAVVQLQQQVQLQQVFFSQPQNLQNILNLIGVLLPTLPTHDGNYYTLRVKDGVLSWVQVGAC